ncbi:DUF5685 family protein [Nocardia sp. NPDC005978]|uniref:DUF5685 family protein n=1 Tax=Nocardia sp. NPDC005978 TaxID=3156725 RepID=UPI00339EA18B
MFGLLKPCQHGAARYGMDAGAWQTQMCGLCLGLRDGHGQLARAATNTDAIVLGVLTEAQQTRTAERTSAGPCPLRGMRRASVAPADSPGVRLATTASLLLGAAKIRDHLDDGETARGAVRPLARVSGRWHAQAHDAAAGIGLDIAPLVAAIESQTALEQAAARHGVHTGPADLDALNRLTAPTQLCAAELFAHTAILAEQPANADALRTAGWHFGRIAHLADAIEDLDHDREHGKFNPLTATGIGAEQAHELLRESNSLLRAALVSVGLERVGSVRWLLLDPLNGVVRRLGRAANVVHACTSRACGSRAGHGSEWSPGTESIETGLGAGHEHSGHEHPADTRKAFGANALLPITSAGAHDVHASYGPPVSKPGIFEGIGIILGQYCTGYACCAEHTRPCSGHRKDAWINRCGCDACNGCGCDGCGCDGCGCDGCCDGCCCDGCGCGCDC